MMSLKRDTLKEIFYGVLLVSIASIVALFSVEIMLRTGVIDVGRAKDVLMENTVDSPRHKILILGDSFLTSNGNGQSLYEQLSKKWKPYSVQILNTAHAGLGPVDYLAQMKAYGNQFKPNIILLFYYVGNDLTNVQYPSNRWNWLKENIKPYVTQLYLYNFIKDKWELLSRKRLNYKKISYSGVSADVISLAQQGKINPWLTELSSQKRNFILDNLLMETEENKMAWRKVQRLLNEINLRSKKMNAQLIVITLPSPMQVNESHFSFYRKLNFNLDDKTLIVDTPQALMMDYCGKENILCLNLLPEFRKNSQREYYLENDDHFNSEGNKMAAGLIDTSLSKYVHPS